MIEAGPLAGLVLCPGTLGYAAKYLTDGFIQMRRRSNCHCSPEVRPNFYQKLVDCSLWERVNGGYQIHDYLDYNPTARVCKG